MTKNNFTSNEYVEGKLMAYFGASELRANSLTEKRMHAWDYSVESDSEQLFVSVKNNVTGPTDWTLSITEFEYSKNNAHYRVCVLKPESDACKLWEFYVSDINRDEDSVTFTSKSGSCSITLKNQVVTDAGLSIVKHDEPDWVG